MYRCLVVCDSPLLHYNNVTEVIYKLLKSKKKLTYYFILIN